jgi:GGDEF domain-containing protein
MFVCTIDPGYTVSVVGAATVLIRKGTVEFRVDDAASLLSQADQALYQSKTSGRNRTTHYSKLAVPKTAVEP